MFLYRFDDGTFIGERGGSLRGFGGLVEAFRSLFVVGAVVVGVDFWVFL